MRVLVTGGAGFIGSNLANTLSADGHEVVVLDDLSLGVPSNLVNAVELVDGSVCDAGTVSKSMRGVESVFHLAAKSSLTMIIDDPVLGEEVNVGGFLRVLEAAREEGVERVVYASTSSIYSGIEPPHSEDMDVTPRTLYEQNLFAREQIASIYTATRDIEAVGMRFFSVYGSNEWHKKKYANLVSQFIWSMLSDERPVIYGDGSQTRDFVHVSDVCRALIQASESEKAAGDIFNVCTGKSYSLNQLVNMINEEIDASIEPRYVENPLKMYVDHTLGDPRKAREGLGFESTISLREGVSMVVRDQEKA
jgi:UDP-glucose 4-epimerase